MKVLIAGGGVGGLSAALSLVKAGIDDITIIEAVSEVRPLGVGINLLPQAAREFEELGLGERIAEYGIPVERTLFFDAHGSEIVKLPRGLNAGYRWPAYFYHRGSLQMLLMDAVTEVLGADRLKTNTRLVDYRNDPDGVTVTVDNGAGTPTYQLHADLVIGADGVHSRTRAIMHPGEGAPLWNGNVMYRATSPLDGDFLDNHTALYGGHFSRRFLAYPVITTDKQTVLNWNVTLAGEEDYLAREDWNRQVDRDRIIEAVAGWNVAGIDVAAVVARAERVFEYPQVDREPLTTWLDGRVVLLGDAAHPMQPTGSNGTSAAVIDGRLLSYELATAGSIEQALANYDTTRVAETSQIVAANRQMADARILMLVHERAPEGFTDIDEVISKEEIASIVDSYQLIAGFQPEQLNSRRSLTPPTPAVTG